LTPASKGTATAAAEAAGRAFGEQPSLPLSSDASPSASPEGRHRLVGAFVIDLSRIRPDRAQPRKNLDTEQQRELNASVKRIGILQPITVRFIETENVYQIIAGERRYRAAKEAGFTEIPCWLRTPDEHDILLHQIAENWQRAELHPYDLADALASLRDAYGYSQKELANWTSKPESEISRLLSLLKLNPAVQQAARKDETGSFTKRHLVA
jgi:ParB family transcriptional regulator, chromosome partitioning protein